jgi:hypothetical protein
MSYRHLERVHETHIGFIHHTLAFLCRRRQTSYVLTWNSHCASCFYYHQRLLLNSFVCLLFDLLHWKTRRKLMTLMVSYRTIMDVWYVKQDSLKSNNSYFWARSSWRKGRIKFVFTPLKPKTCLHRPVFKNPVRTAKKTQLFTITKINWLTLFKEITAVYTENHTKPINTLLCKQNTEVLIVNIRGTYSYHWAVKG